MTMQSATFIRSQSHDNATIDSSGIEQYSIARSLVLHLLPGVLIVSLYVATAPLAMMLGTLLILLAFELGHLLWEGKRRNGKWWKRNIKIGIITLCVKHHRHAVDLRSGFRIIASKPSTTFVVADHPQRWSFCLMRLSFFLAMLFSGSNVIVSSRNGGTMYQSREMLTGKELGLYLGILSGIAVLQSSGQIAGLVICAIIGVAMGAVVDQITKRINLRLGCTEEE